MKGETSYLNLPLFLLPNPLNTASSESSSSTSLPPTTTPSRTSSSYSLESERNKACAFFPLPLVVVRIAGTFVVYAGD